MMCQTNQTINKTIVESIDDIQSSLLWLKCLPILDVFVGRRFQMCGTGDNTPPWQICHEYVDGLDVDNDMLANIKPGINPGGCYYDSDDQDCWILLVDRPLQPFVRLCFVHMPYCVNGRPIGRFYLELKPQSEE